MIDQPQVDRRSVLHVAGGLIAAGTLASLGVGTSAAHAHGRYVRVNQVGYLPNAKKIAIVVDDEVSGTSFEVVDRGSGSVVYDGPLSAPVHDPIANHAVRHAEFSDLEEPGEYVVRVGGDSSFPFTIDEDVYDDLLATVGRLYTLKRSGVDVDDPVTGLRYTGGHHQDAQAQVTATGDPVYDEGDTVDASGGWYDAGDYGKYVAPSAITVGAKLAAFERNPEAFAVGQYDFPPGISEADRGRMPDALVELKWKLEWLEKVQRRDGATWFIVSGRSWPSTSTAPNEDTQQRYVFGLSSAATAMACATFAQAGRIYREHDRAFADRMLENAEAAFAWLEDNPQLVWRIDPLQDAGSGTYHRGAEFEDPDRFRESELADDHIDGATMERFDRFWAAAELLKTTGERRYHDYLEANCSQCFSQEPIDFDWYNGLAIGQWAYYSADAADPSRREEVGQALTSWADARLERVAEDGYNVALEARDYHWASVQKAATYGVTFLLANAVEPKQAYVDAALDQLHHVLGRSATGYCYVTGVGSHSPQNPHDRLVNSTGTLIPGMVVGGPNDDDVWAGAGLSPSAVPYDDPGTAQLYVDQFSRYECNEWAINYTAPVFWLLAEAVTLESDDPGTGCDGIQVGEYCATDPDGDGTYTDVNGNGGNDFDDVVTFFEEMQSDGVQDNVDAFDFNENGGIDFDDVVALFETV